jgi:protein-tyrosine phosphatase
MVIACYLVAEYGMAVHAAIQAVRAKRPHSLVCQKQELAVYRFATYLDEKAKAQQR